MRDSADGFDFVVKCWCPVNTAHKKTQPPHDGLYPANLRFQDLGCRKVEADFKGGNVSASFPCFFRLAPDSNWK